LVRKIAPRVFGFEVEIGVRPSGTSVSGVVAWRPGEQAIRVNSGGPGEFDVPGSAVPRSKSVAPPAGGWSSGVQLFSWRVIAVAVSVLGGGRTGCGDAARPCRPAGTVPPERRVGVIRVPVRTSARDRGLNRSTLPRLGPRREHQHPARPRSWGPWGPRAMVPPGPSMLVHFTQRPLVPARPS